VRKAKCRDGEAIMKKKSTGQPKKSRTQRQQEPLGDLHPAFARTAEVFAKDRQVTYGKMFASMGLKVNGKIFAMFVKGRFVAKLPRERVDEIVRLGKGEYFDPGHGRLMKEWVSLYGETPSWIELAREAHRFVKDGRS
jgi:TfoX/Sxy family transcriptional regulator of competence genes